MTKFNYEAHMFESLTATLLELAKCIKRHHAVCERACNDGLTDGQEKRKEELESYIEFVGGILKLRVEFSNDPRGETVRTFPVQNS